jgi:hypothetical protein
MRLFGEITKIEEAADGTLKVYGVASSGARDDAGEIVMPAAMKAALPDYARYPTLREMHQPSAAGRTLEALVDEEGATRIVAQVVDPVAIAKVKSRTYSGFSIGGRVLARDPVDPTVITKIKLSEISLVDRPANPEAVIDLWKADPASDAPEPGNEAVKARAAQMAADAGRPGAWKDFVAKARAALMAEQAASPVEGEPADSAAGDNSDDSAGPDEAGADDPDADGDAGSGDEDDGEYGAPADDADEGAGASAGDFATRIAGLLGSNPAALQAAHDLLAALGASCHSDVSPPADGSDTDDLARLAKALPRVEALERRLEAQSALIERLAATPIPPKTAASGHARAVGKAEDADPVGGADDPDAADVQKAFSLLTADERAFLLMKAALRQPMPVG